MRLEVGNGGDGVMGEKERVLLRVWILFVKKEPKASGRSLRLIKEESAGMVVRFRMLLIVFQSFLGFATFEEMRVELYNRLAVMIAEW